MNRTDTTSYLALRPRLLHETVGGEMLGFLKLSPSGDPIRIGPVDSPEYRLVESFFGTEEAERRNDRFHALTDTTEHVYSEVTHTELLEGVQTSSRMQAVIDSAIRQAIDRLAQTPAGRYLAVRLTGRHLLMKIHPA